MNVNTEGSFNRELLESIFRTSKKTIQEYVREIERNNRISRYGEIWCRVRYWMTAAG